MTVAYNAAVINGSKGFGNFLKLLFRWRGSIYKVVLLDLLIYVIFYYVINVVYRLCLREKDPTNNIRMKYHQLVEYCSREAKHVPLQFVLSFYVSNIVSRWWEQFMSIPWPDTLAFIVATSVQGHDDRGRMMRRTIMRYVNLCLQFTFVLISPQARKRFPTLDHLVNAGFLLPHEKSIVDHINERLDGPKYFVPIVWAGAIGAKARKEQRIRDDVSLYHFIKELCKFRVMAGNLLSYDWISFPLVYTQVVTIAVHIYFLACLVGKQMLKQDDRIDLYVAFFEFLEFFFMMGWLKVAETLINPFGEDDDDFEVNWLIDRNIIVSYIIVDEMNTEFPELVHDQYWELGVPEELFYTETAKKYKTEGYAGSAAVAMHDDHHDHHDHHDYDHHHERKQEGDASHHSQMHSHSPSLHDHTFIPREKDSIMDTAEK